MGVWCVYAYISLTSHIQPTPVLVSRGHTPFHKKGNFFFTAVCYTAQYTVRTKASVGNYKV